jgi:hypothetical protein
MSCARACYLGHGASSCANVNPCDLSHYFYDNNSVIRYDIIMIIIIIRSCYDIIIIIIALL